jgi:hypothetical protein
MENSRGGTLTQGNGSALLLAFLLVLISWCCFAAHVAVAERTRMHHEIHDTTSHTRTNQPQVRFRSSPSKAGRKMGHAFGRHTTTVPSNVAAGDAPESATRSAQSGDGDAPSDEVAAQHAAPAHPLVTVLRYPHEGGGRIEEVIAALRRRVWQSDEMSARHLTLRKILGLLFTPDMLASELVAAFFSWDRALLRDGVRTPASFTRAGYYTRYCVLDTLQRLEAAVADVAQNRSRFVDSGEHRGGLGAVLHAQSAHLAMALDADAVLVSSRFGREWYQSDHFTRSSCARRNLFCLFQPVGLAQDLLPLAPQLATAQQERSYTAPRLVNASCVEEHNEKRQFWRSITLPYQVRPTRSLQERMAPFFQVNMAELERLQPCVSVFCRRGDKITEGRWKTYHLPTANDYWRRYMELMGSRPLDEWKNVFFTTDSTSAVERWMELWEERFAGVEDAPRLVLLDTVRDPPNWRAAHPNEEYHKNHITVRDARDTGRIMVAKTVSLLCDDLLSTQASNSLRIIDDLRRSLHPWRASTPLRAHNNSIMPTPERFHDCTKPLFPRSASW